MMKVVGIDLGTTFSAIATLDDRGQPVTLPNHDGEMLTPSAILLEDGSAIVGQPALDVALEQPDRVAMLIKRHMGQASFGRPVAGRAFRPETLAAIILRKLVQDVTGGDAGPGEGWSVGVTLNPADPTGGTLSPVGTQATRADGTPAEPWRVSFSGADQTAAVSVFEVQQDGYSFVSGRCTITAIDDTTRTVSFEDGGVAQLTGTAALRPGDAAVCELTNRQLPGEVTWAKVDGAEPGNPLGGAEWQLTRQGPAGAALGVTDCVAGTAGECGTGPDLDPRAGHFRVSGLAWDSYELVETRAPAGYYLDPAPRTFTVDAGQLGVTLDPVVNLPREVPLLPLTGGLGRDGVMLLGAGVIALGLAAAGVLRFRTAHPAALRRS